MVDIPRSVRQTQPAADQLKQFPVSQPPYWILQTRVAVTENIHDIETIETVTKTFPIIATAAKR